MYSFLLSYGITTTAFKGSKMFLFIQNLRSSFKLRET